MKQFRFYCDKLHCIRSDIDIVQSAVMFVSVKYDECFKHECFKQIEDCPNQGGIHSNSIVQTYLLKDGLYIIHYCSKRRVLIIHC